MDIPSNNGDVTSLHEYDQIFTMETLSPSDDGSVTPPITDDDDFHSNINRRNRKKKARNKFNSLWFIPNEVLNNREDQDQGKGNRQGLRTYRRLSCRECNLTFHRIVGLRLHYFLTSTHSHIDLGQMQSFVWKKRSNDCQTGQKKLRLAIPEDTVDSLCTGMEAVREENVEDNTEEIPKYIGANKVNEPREMVNKDQGIFVPVPPKSAYDLYLKLMKTELVKVNVSLLRDVTDEQRDEALAVKWKTLSWNEKKVFFDKSEKDFQRYIKELSGLDK